MSTTLTYPADGLTMRSELFTGAGDGRRPGILVFPEAFGLGRNALDRAARLADLGYVALASDLHGEARLESDLQAAIGLIDPLRTDPLRTRARAQAGLQALLARPEVDPARIAAIGFCFGGTMALELARAGTDLRAVVGFHAGLATTRPEDAAAIRARVHVFIGADDPSIPAAQRAGFEAEMTAGKVDWQLTVFGGVVHSFTNPGADALGKSDFARYDRAADERSWAGMRQLFDEAFA